MKKLGILFLAILIPLLGASTAPAQPQAEIKVKTFNVPQIVQVPAVIKNVQLLPTRVSMKAAEEKVITNGAKMLVNQEFSQLVNKSLAVYPKIEALTRVGNRLKAESLIVFLAKDTYTATISRVNYEVVGDKVTLLSKVENYSPLIKTLLTPGPADTSLIKMKKDLLANLQIALPQGWGPKALANTPCNDIATAVDGTTKVYNTFVQAFGSADKKVGSPSTKAALLEILQKGTRLVAWNNIGHGNPSCIVQWNGEPVWDSDFNSSNLFRGIYQSVILLNSCQTCASPYNLKNAIKKHNPRTYIAGAKNLPIGPSEKVDIDFWNLSLLQNTAMGPALAQAQTNHGLAGYFCLDGFNGKFAEVEAGKISEDCIPFNPQTVTAKQVQGHWKIVSGSMWMLDFGNHEDQAKLAEKIIKHYKLDKQCFVGRPNAPMMYWTVNGQSPQGAFPGEDAITINPNNVAAAKIGGRWKVTDGPSWLLDFDQKEAEAKIAATIIKHYGFTRQCFVGRPNAPMMYFRK